MMTTTKKIVSGFIAICFMPKFIFCTCIVISKKEQAIYVAADTRSVYSLVINGSAVKESQTICKIKHVGNVYYSVCGHDDRVIASKASESLMKYKDVEMAVQYFSNEMKSHYAKLMNWEKGSYKEDYKYYIKNPLASVAFYGFKYGRTYLIVVSFDMTDKNGIVIESKIDKNLDDVILGYQDHINKLTDADYAKFPRTNFSYFQESVVKVEIAQHGEYVNYPIDLLQLTDRGPNWVRKNQTCD